MNFLAHLWLTERVGLPLAGAVLGDVVRGRDLGAYPPPLQASIRLHRRIDAQTDREPVVVAARARFVPGARRYAGILLDVLYDHALARQWPMHASGRLEDFALRAGEALAAERAWFAHAGARAPQAGPFAELLLSYREPAGIDEAIMRIARRLSAPQGLLDAARDWRARMPELERELPELLHALSAPSLHSG